MKYAQRECENPGCRTGEGGGAKRYTPTRVWQRFCSRRCRAAVHEAARIYVPLAKRRKRPSAASPTQLSARRPFHVATALVEGAGVFSTIAGRPRNFAGAMTRVTLSNPSFMLRLAAAVRNDGRDGRPNCQECGKGCADGVACSNPLVTLKAVASDKWQVASAPIDSLRD